MISHPFDPIFNAQSEVLVLGSFPSVISREKSFYYANPQNRFWPMIANLWNVDFENSEKNKIDELQKHHVALWDVVGSCEIRGSDDASISLVQPNRLERILDNSMVKLILLNGKKAGILYQKYFKDYLYPFVILPSTSSANARWTMEKLQNEWGKYL